MLKGLPKIIIFSDPVCIDDIINNPKISESLIVSFSLNGKLALEKKGLRCLFPDELIKLPDLNRIGLDNLERVKDICNFLDKKLQEKIGFLKKNNINLFYAGFFRIKVFFDTLYTSYHILNELFTLVRKKEIILFKTNSTPTRVIRGQDSIVPPLIEEIFSKKCNDYKIIICDKSDYKNKMIQLLNYFKRGVSGGYKTINSTAKQYKDNGLVLDDRFDIPYVVKEVLDSTHFYKIHIDNNYIMFKSISSSDASKTKIVGSNSEVSSCIREIFSDAINNQTYRDMFHCDDDLIAFANKYLEEYILKSVGEIIPLGSKIKNYIINLRPKMLLTASCRLYLKEAFLLEVIRSLNIPVITYQEGGGAGYIDWPLFNIDMDLSDFFLAYGRGVKESPLIRKSKAEVVPVGSIHLDQIKKTIKNSTPTRLTIYVILDNLKTNTYQHYPYNGGFFSQAYNHQLKILNTLRQFREARFVLKTIKGREFLYDTFIEDKFIQLETMPLSKILNSASAFILDYPSTVLQECLLTDKPVALLYSQDNVKFDPEALESLSKEIRISSNPNEFSEVIKALIEDAKCGTVRQDDDFLKKYCLTEKTADNLRIFFSGILTSVYS